MLIERHLVTPFFFPNTGKSTKCRHCRTLVGLSIMSDGAAPSCTPLYLSSDGCINSDSAPNATDPSLATPPSTTLDFIPKPPHSVRDCEKHFSDAMDVPLEASLKRTEHEAKNQTLTDKHPVRSRKSFTLYQPSSFLDSPSLWLALYFALNLWLTLYNKSVLIQFPFPYTLTALHAFCGTIGASILLRLQGPDLNGFTSTGVTTQKSSWSFFHKITPDLSLGESIVLLFFSMLYTINIVVSNASLRLVTVPVSHLYLVPGNLFFISLLQFHQVVRASTPFFTIVFSLILLGKRCTKRKLCTLIPVVAGVCFA